MAVIEDHLQIIYNPVERIPWFKPFLANMVFKQMNKCRQLILVTTDHLKVTKQGAWFGKTRYWKKDNSSMKTKILATDKAEQ